MGKCRSSYIIYKNLSRQCKTLAIPILQWNSDRKINTYNTRPNKSLECRKHCSFSSSEVLVRALNYGYKIIEKVPYSLSNNDFLFGLDVDVKNYFLFTCGCEELRHCIHIYWVTTILNPIVLNFIQLLAACHYQYFQVTQPSPQLNSLKENAWIWGLYSDLMLGIDVWKFVTVGPVSNYISYAVLASTCR